MKVTRRIQDNNPPPSSNLRYSPIVSHREVSTTQPPPYSNYSTISPLLYTSPAITVAPSVTAYEYTTQDGLGHVRVQIGAVSYPFAHNVAINHKNQNYSPSNKHITPVKQQQAHQPRLETETKSEYSPPLVIPAYHTSTPSPRIPPPTVLAHHSTTSPPAIPAYHSSTPPTRIPAYHSSSPPPRIPAYHSTTPPPAIPAFHSSTPPPSIPAYHSTTLPPAIPVYHSFTPHPRIPAFYSSTPHPRITVYHSPTLPARIPSHQLSLTPLEIHPPPSTHNDKTSNLSSMEQQSDNQAKEPMKDDTKTKSEKLKESDKNSTSKSSMPKVKELPPLPFYNHPHHALPSYYPKPSPHSIHSYFYPPVHHANSPHQSPASYHHHPPSLPPPPVIPSYHSSTRPSSIPTYHSSTFSPTSPSYPPPAYHSPTPPPSYFGNPTSTLAPPTAFKYSPYPFTSSIPQHYDYNPKPRKIENNTYTIQDNIEEEENAIPSRQQKAITGAKVLEMFKDHSLLSPELLLLPSNNKAMAEAKEESKVVQIPNNLEQVSVLQQDTLINGNKNTIGKVLEEFKNKAALSLQNKDNQIQLIGPIYVVTNGPRAFSLFKPFEQQIKTEELPISANEGVSASKRSLSKRNNHFPHRDTPAIKFEDDGVYNTRVATIQV